MNSAAVIGRQLRQQQASSRAAGPVVPPTQYKGRQHAPVHGGSHNSNVSGAVNQQNAHHYHLVAAGSVGTAASNCAHKHSSNTPWNAKSHVVPSSSSGSLHGNLVRCLYQSQQDPNKVRRASPPFCCSVSENLPPYDLIVPSHTLPIIDIIDSPTPNKHPFTVESYLNDVTSRPLHTRHHRHSGIDANKKFAQFSALYTHHEFYPHPAHRETAQDRATRRVVSKDKQKSDEQNRRFHCTGHCFCVALKALSAGIVLLVIGTAMTLVGFFAERFPEDNLNGPPPADNFSNSPSSDSSKSHLHNLTYVGPVIMGLGGIVLVAACILTFEVRDTLGTKRRHDLSDLDCQSPVDPEAPGSGSYLQVPEELLHKLIKVQQQQTHVLPSGQQQVNSEPIEMSKQQSQKMVQLKGNNLEKAHVTKNLCKAELHVNDCNPSSLQVLNMHDSNDSSSQAHNNVRQQCHRRTKCKHKNKHRSRRKATRNAHHRSSSSSASRPRTKASYANSAELWIPSPAETDFSDLEGCSQHPSPTHYRSSQQHISSLNSDYLNVPIRAQMPSRDAKILASVESDGLFELASCSLTNVYPNLPDNRLESSRLSQMFCQSSLNMLAESQVEKQSSRARTLSLSSNGLAFQVSQV